MSVPGRGRPPASGPCLLGGAAVSDHVGRDEEQQREDPEEVDGRETLPFAERSDGTIDGAGLMLCGLPREIEGPGVGKVSLLARIRDGLAPEDLPRTQSDEGEDGCDACGYTRDQDPEPRTIADVRVGEDGQKKGRPALRS